METQITNGVKISVETFFQPNHSRPVIGKFVYSYKVTIENQNPFPVQLLRRHWYIFDAFGTLREVEGEGVIGEKPILSPGQVHQYSSWSQLSAEIGKMYGYYLMEDQTNGRQLKINIPEFKLIAPHKLN